MNTRSFFLLLSLLFLFVMCKKESSNERQNPEDESEYSEVKTEPAEEQPKLKAVNKQDSLSLLSFYKEINGKNNGI